MSKNATIRLPEETQNRLKENFGGIQTAISLIVEPFEKLRILTLSELKGYFTKEEMTALVDSQNGTMLTPDFIYNKSFLIAQLEDFEQLEAGFSRHNADYGNVIGKINSLSQSQVYFLLISIHISWNTGTVSDLIGE